MCVDNRCKVDSAGVNMLPQDRCHSVISLSLMVVSRLENVPHSEGFAGSMMTASFDLSSTTR